MHKYTHIVQSCICMECRPADQILPIIDIGICKSEHLACFRRQNQNVLSDACRDVEKIQEYPKIKSHR